MITKEQLQYYTFAPLDRFKNDIIHCFTTRNTGVSSGLYKSLNLGLHVGDNLKNVIDNRHKTVAVLNLSLHQGIALKQIHGNHVVAVNESALGRGMFSYDDSYCEADGMVTSTAGILLTTYYADCVPIYIYNPKVKAIGLAHAGWKGSVLKIASKLVECLSENFNSKPSDCVVVIGPSIGPCCYEVEELVIEAVKDIFDVSDDFIELREKGKTNLNLWEINKRLLQESGVSNQNIYISKLCTSCMEKYFYSHRRDGAQTGRMSAILSIRG